MTHAFSGRFAEEMTTAIAIAVEAGHAIRDLYDRSAADTYTKEDGSPVTDADLASDAIIRQRLAAAFPDDAILTEEGVDDAVRLGAPRTWVVDPIDGTQQFVERTGEFDVLIALVVDGRSVVGVLHQPTTGITLAGSLGNGAWIISGDSVTPLRFEPVPESRGPRLITSTWLGAPGALPLLNRVAADLGSPDTVTNRLGISVRMFVPPWHAHDVLVGVDHREDHTMAWEWDFAAADIVVHEAGGALTDVHGNLHRYNKPVPRNLMGIILSVDPVTHARVVESLGRHTNGTGIA